MKPRYISEVMNELQQGVSIHYELRLLSWYDEADRYAAWLRLKFQHLLRPKSLDAKREPLVSEPLRNETGWRPVRKHV